MADKCMGMSDNSVVLPGGQKVSPVGHWLYVRKCIEPDVVDEATGKLLIALPEWSKDFAEKPYAWVELLAKGPDVGKTAGGMYGKMLKQRGYPCAHIVDVTHVGDRLLIPHEPWRFFHSPYESRGTAFYIDASVPLMVYDGQSYHPCGYNVLVEPFDLESGDSIIKSPQWSKERYGIVRSVGPGEIGPKKQRIGCCVEPGETILLPQQTTDFWINGKKYFIVRDSDIPAVIDLQETA